MLFRSMPRYESPYFCVLFYFMYLFLFVFAFVVGVVTKAHYYPVGGIAGEGECVGGRGESEGRRHRCADGKREDNCAGEERRDRNREEDVACPTRSERR